MKFDGLSAEAERLFVRLIMKADDYGRFHADPRLLRSACYPLAATLRDDDLVRLLDELRARQLVLVYEVIAGGSPPSARKLLAIVNFGQRLKQSKPKFPPLDGEKPDWLPTSGNFPELPAVFGDGVVFGDGYGDDRARAPARSAESQRGFDEHLAREDALTQAEIMAIPKDFSAYVWDDWESRGGKDAGQNPVPWVRYVKKRWDREQNEWKSGKHRGNRKNTNRSDVGTCSTGTDYRAASRRKQAPPVA